VVLLREATARPAHDRYPQALERRDDVVANAALVRDRRVLADPDALVDAAAEVLGEVAVDVALDGRTRPIRADGDGGREGRRGLRVQVRDAGERRQRKDRQRGRGGYQTNSTP
jgi:hypothetical protein